MCSPILCNLCKKITYIGCGKHVDIVLQNFTSEQRCICKEKASN